MGKPPDKKESAMFQLQLPLRKREPSKEEAAYLQNQHDKARRYFLKQRKKS